MSDKFPIDIDMSDWLLGDWPERLARCVSVNHKVKDSGEIEVELKVDKKIFEDVSRQVAKDAIEAFFNEDGPQLDITLSTEDGGFVYGTLLTTDDQEISSSKWETSFYGFLTGVTGGGDLSIAELAEDSPNIREKLVSIRALLARSLSEIDEFLSRGELR